MKYTSKERKTIKKFLTEQISLTSLAQKIQGKAPAFRDAIEKELFKTKKVKLSPKGLVEFRKHQRESMVLVVKYLKYLLKRV